MKAELEARKAADEAKKKLRRGIEKRDRFLHGRKKRPTLGQALTLDNVVCATILAGGRHVAAHRSGADIVQATVPDMLLPSTIPPVSSSGLCCYTRRQSLDVQTLIGKQKDPRFELRSLRRNKYVLGDPDLIKKWHVTDVWTRRYHEDDGLQVPIEEWTASWKESQVEEDSLRREMFDEHLLKEASEEEKTYMRGQIEMRRSVREWAFKRSYRKAKGTKRRG